MIEHYIGVVTRNIEKASGTTTDAKTSTSSAKELQGAVYFQADSLFDGEYPIPALPMIGTKEIDIPPVGTEIRIEMDSSIDSPDPRYSTIIYNTDDKMPDVFATNYPNRRGKETPSGHQLIYDDKSGDLWLKHRNGHRVFFDDNGNVKVEHAAGQILHLTNNFVDLIEKGGAKLRLKDGKVALGSTQEICDIIDQFLAKVISTETKIALHVHPSVVGLTGPPTTAGEFTQLATDLGDIKTALNQIKGTLS